MTDKKLKKDIFARKIDGNAYAILGAFSKQARLEGWDKAEIDEVMTEAKEGTYAELMQTLMRHIE